ncbi:unnamed protein product, partial [Haemonchus placei]|uniref:CAP-Gly domain-containing protein n=1 Tax=Haemonchus placei TaxID=6290 RepID=A0A0N4WIW0_HAEPC
MASNSRLQKSDSKESILSLTSCVSGVGTWQVGDRARIDQRSGTVAYVGPTKFAPGEWIGLVLDDPLGKNDGSVQGYRYFTCTPDHGLFCKSSKLDRIMLSPARFTSPAPGEGEPKSPYAAEYGFDIDDRVVVSGGKQGVVRFIGETEFAQGIWAGIELEQPLGKNDGSVQGKRYFTCKSPYGVFVPASKAQKAPSQTPNKMKQGHYSESSTIKALQEALQEKERHLEQLMREREMERSEFGQIGNGDQAEKIAKLKTEKKALENELLAKDKLIEDLNFRLEEEVIAKECQVQELKQQLVPNSEVEESLDTHSSLTSEIISLKEELKREKEAHQLALESEKANSKAKENLLEALRSEFGVTKDLLAHERLAKEKDLGEANAAIEEKSKLLEAAEQSFQAAQKELEKMKAELQSALSDVKTQKELVENLMNNKESADATLTQRLTTLENELETKKKDWQAMEQEKKSLEEQFKVIEKQLTETSGSLVALQQEKSMMQEALETLKSEKASINERLLEEQKNNEAAVKEHLEKIRLVTVEKESAEAALLDARTTSETLKAEKIELEGRLALIEENSDGVAKDAENRCSTLEAELKAMSKEKTIMEETVKTLKNEIASINERVLEEQKNNETVVKEQLEKIRSITVEKEAAEAALVDAKKAGDSLATEKNELEQRLALIKENSDGVAKDAEIRCSTLEGELKAMREEKAIMEETVKSLKSEIASVNERSLEEQKNNEVVVKEQLEKIRSVTVEKETAEAALKDARTVSESLKAEKIELEARLAAIKENSDSATKEAEGRCSMLEAKLKDVEAQHISALTAAKAAHDELLGKCGLLESQISTIEKNHLDVKEQFKNKESELQKAEQELKRLGEEVKTLVEKLDVATKEHDLVVESKALIEEELRKQTSALNTLQNTVNASNMDQSAMATELASVTTLCAERLAENNKLQETVKSVESKLQSAEAANAEITAKLKESEERSNDLVKQKDDAIRETGINIHQYSRLNSKSEEVNAQVNKLNAELSAKHAELESVLQEKNVVNGEKEKAEDQLTAMSLKIQELEQKLVDSQHAVEVEQKKKLDDIEAQGSELRGELSAANEKNSQ